MSACVSTAAESAVGSSSEVSTEPVGCNLLSPVEEVLKGLSLFCI